ncbi:MAG TPA: histone deacetylase [Vicinamibacterales bacterium]|nr:histone deacetylase [Vicinamibacterales bacterium]
MRVVYSPRYQPDLGAHVFPTAKYHAVADRITDAHIVTARTFVEPVEATWDDLALVHTAAYLDGLRDGTLSAEAMARLEIPCSPATVDGFRLMTGGTLVAARLALDGTDRTVVHLGGGFHHAFAGHGEGFCMFNDVAVAIRAAFRDRMAASAAVIDLDVHQGNGTAAIFGRQPRVFTLSIHEEDNYPYVKPRGSLDLGLPGGTGDDSFLGVLEGALARALEARPDIVLYLAGADPYADDQLGGLALTRAGLRRRARMVFDAARGAGVPVVVLLAGGYARHLEDTVAIHAATVEEAARI